MKNKQINPKLLTIAIFSVSILVAVAAGEGCFILSQRPCTTGSCSVGVTSGGVLSNVSNEDGCTNGTPGDTICVTSNYVACSYTCTVTNTSAQVLQNSGTFTNDNGGALYGDVCH